MIAAVVQSAAPPLNYARPFLPWVKRRARSIQRAWKIDRSRAVLEAAHDYAAFTGADVSPAAWRRHRYVPAAEGPAGLAAGARALLATLRREGGWWSESQLTHHYQPTFSLFEVGQHLASLRRAGLVTRRRSLASPQVFSYSACLGVLRERGV